MSAHYPVLVAVSSPAEASLVRALETEPDIDVVSRCADVAELLALASTGRAVAAFVCRDFRQFDRTALARLRAEGIAVVGVLTGEPDQATSHLAALGISTTVPADPAAGEPIGALEKAIDRLARGRSWDADPAAELDRLALVGSADDDLDPVDFGPDGRDGGRHGRLIAVWGPTGAPGRTTVAVNLAGELAGAGAAVLLADADTYGASIAQGLGILDEAPGLAAACRAAAVGGLDLVTLARLSPLVAPTLRVLTGITRSDRWPELSSAGLQEVWTMSRRLADWTVVDCGFSLEQDEELSYDTMAPRRNASTLVTLTDADLVLAVGSADPVGLQRLIRALSDLAEVVPGIRPEVVLTKVRAGAVGSDPGRRVREALHRYAGVPDVHLIPDDREALDRALLAGRSVVEIAPSGPLRAAIGGLAAAVRGVPVAS